MEATIASSLISAAVTLIICLIQQNKTLAVMGVKIDELQKRMDRHNNLIERVYSAEKDIKANTVAINSINHRVDGLEGKVS